MTIEFSSKQPYEEYYLSFDFADYLGIETIASASIVALDQTDGSDVSSTLLDLVKQSNTTTVVYGWVRSGTSGHDYLITCYIVGDAGSRYELEGILPVLETPPAGIVSGGGWSLVVAPIIEPITLAELKLHLRLDSGSLADNIDQVQTIAPGSHTTTSGYALLGTAVEVLGYSSLVSFAAGTNQATGTVDVKIQESDDNSTWSDWPTGAFTQVTTANDNATYEKAYTGSKRYIRVACKVLLASCAFGVTVIRQSPQSSEDDLLNALITAAREHVEDITRRALLTQTWDFPLQSWPQKNYIKLPRGNLQSVTSVKWKDSDGTETTLVAGTDYLVETNGPGIGKVVLPYGGSWPSGELYPSNPITIRFVCGWTTAASIPSKIIAAVKMIAADLYEQRGEPVVGQTVVENKTVERLLASARLWDEF